MPQVERIQERQGGGFFTSLHRATQPCAGPHLCPCTEQKQQQQQPAAPSGRSGPRPWALPHNVIIFEDEASTLTWTWELQDPQRGSWQLNVDIQSELSALARRLGAARQRGRKLGSATSGWVSDGFNFPGCGRGLPALRKALASLLQRNVHVFSLLQWAPCSDHITELGYAAHF